MRVLRVMAVHPEGVGVSRLALQLGVGKSSAHLLLATLADAEFVVQRSDGRYQLGVGAIEIGAAAGAVAAAGGPLTEELRGLAQRCGEAVSLASASGRDAVIVQRIESASVLRAEIQVGTRMPMHSSASGKYLLSQMSEEVLDRLYPEEELPGMTNHTLRDRSELLAELAEVRRRGHAMNDDEYTDGVSGVATGVCDATDTAVLALSIAGPSHRFQPGEWLDDLRATASRMTDVLRGMAPAAFGPRVNEAGPLSEREA
jgi:DNA-binding IclR family transcriptional regulator